jgi:mRNA-degrading endonuclease RelE of RelBE toxin-antitoxin system
VYEVYLEGAAERDLKRLSSEIFHRIIKNIKGLRVNPRPPGCSKAVKILRFRYQREAYG